MAITRISYTQEIPGIKVKAASVSEANGYIGQVTQGELFEVNGELMFKTEKNSTSLTPVGQGLVVTGTIATADVLTLNGTPITLIAAPGAGKVIIVDEIQLFLDYNSAGYVAAAGEDLSFEYTGSTTIATVDSDGGFITATADAQIIAKPNVYDIDNSTTENGFDINSEANLGVDITVLTGELATGDSPLKYSVKYRVIDLLT